MMTCNSEQFLYLATGLGILTEPSGEWDTKIAINLGWTGVQHRPFIGGYGGINPATGKLEKVPAFTQSMDAAWSTKPDLWVLSIRETYAGLHYVSCRPRGDLDKTQVETNSPWAAIAICHATMQARYQMLS